MSLIFIERNHVKKDMENFANSLKEKYEVQDLQIIGLEDELYEDREKWIGFQVQKDNQVYRIVRCFQENTKGQLAVKKNSWVVQREGIDSIEYTTLGAAFDSLI
jgi:uncharacterized protein with gpF-like domain